jgi:hypothetical protein
LMLAACGTAEPTEVLPTLAPTLDASAGDSAAPTQESSDAGNQVAPTQEVLEEFEDEVDESEETESEVDLELGEGGNGLFTGVVTGSLEETITGNGLYSCEEGANVLSSNSGVNQIEFSLPSTIEPGEYTIGVGETGIQTTLLIDNNNYAIEAFGILTLAAVPVNPGDPVSGTYDMNFVAGELNLNVVGSFELLAFSVCLAS